MRPVLVSSESEIKSYSTLLDKTILKYCKRSIQNPRQSFKKNLSLVQTLARTKISKRVRANRVISQIPERILDAPEILDDYYLNLLDWSRSNGLLAVCLNQAVFLWDSESGKTSELMKTQSSGSFVTSVAWSDSYNQGLSNIIAVGLSTKQVQLMDAETQQCIRVFDRQHRGRVGSLAWNGSFILSSGSLDAQILNNDIRMPNSLICRYIGHEQEVCGLKWSPDGTQLASGSNDNLLCVWDLNSMQNNEFRIHRPKAILREHKAAVKAIAWCPWQRNLLATGGGSLDKSIKFWNTNTCTLINSFSTESQVCSLQWNPHSQEILSSHGFVNNELSLWKYPQMTKITDLKGHSCRVLHMALSPDGTTVVSAAADETLRFWKVFELPDCRKSAVNGLKQLAHKENVFCEQLR